MGHGAPERGPWSDGLCGGALPGGCPARWGAAGGRVLLPLSGEERLRREEHLRGGGRPLQPRAPGSGEGCHGTRAGRGVTRQPEGRVRGKPWGSQLGGRGPAVWSVQ